MGTNYYAVKRKPRIIEVYDEIHLGKASCGWKFCFHEQKEYHNFEQFKQFILNDKDYEIKDEYGNIIEPEELLKDIEEMQKNENPDNFTYDKNVNGYRFCDEDFS